MFPSSTVPDRAAAERGVRVPHFGMRARDARRLLRLEPRVGHVRARRRLERDDELGVVILREEPDADGARGGITPSAAMTKNTSTDDAQREPRPAFGSRLVVSAKTSTTERR